MKPLLADDWIVVSGFGDIADKPGFIDFIRMSGARKTMILSEQRVRLYGDTALVTTHLDAMGPFVKEVNGKVVRKCFAVKERQTDVLVWRNGGWESELLHETMIRRGPRSAMRCPPALTASSNWSKCCVGGMPRLNSVAASYYTILS